MLFTLSICAFSFGRKSDNLISLTSSRFEWIIILFFIFLLFGRIILLPNLFQLTKCLIFISIQLVCTSIPLFVAFINHILEPISFPYERTPRLNNLDLVCPTNISTTHSRYSTSFPYSYFVISKLPQLQFRWPYTVPPEVPNRTLILIIPFK